MDGERSPVSAPPVLVVDDDAIVRRLYVTALKRAGFATLEAPDGASALSILESAPVGLLLIDNHMPGISGVEVIERVRGDDRTRTLPAILITGSGDLPNRLRGLDVGANDYVVKTTDLREIVARVRAQVRASSDWTDAVARQVEERARLVMALGSVQPAESAEETAAALVAELARLDAVALAGLFEVDVAGRLSPLASWTPGDGISPSGLALSPAASRSLVERTGAGPWMEAAGQWTAATFGSLLPPDAGVLAGAPMRLGGQQVGLLLLGAHHDGESPNPTGDLLAATIDYAAVSTAVLGPALRARGREVTARLRLEQMLAERAFHPVFQPLVGLSDGEVVGYEGLTRFDDGVAPDVRFAEAARHGLGRAFEEAAVAEILRVGERLPRDRWLGINLTPQLALEADWLERLIGGAERRLIVELTEHSPISDYDRLRQTLERLPASISVAVDDAGAGYASLRHIYELRPQFVKLDMTLVRDIEKDPVRQALVAGLVHFAEDTGSRLIAEGIETEAEAAVMRMLHVTLGQGFLFGYPSEVDDLSERSA